jgi:hypothetical protein
MLLIGPLGPDGIFLLTNKQMSNYALDSPINRKMYVPGEDELPVAPVTFPKPPTETDQTHRRMDWLHHKPQEHAIFPKKAEAVKIEKKKRSD